MSAPLPFAQRYRTIVAAIATIACCDIAMGLTLQLLPLLMEQNRIPAWIMGLNAAMAPLGIMLGGPFLPRIVSRLGSKRVVHASIIMTMAMLAAAKGARSMVANSSPGGRSKASIRVLSTASHENGGTRSRHARNSSA